MSVLNLKPTHKIIRAYFGEIQKLGTLNILHEGGVAPAFAMLLRHCAGQLHWTLAEQHPLTIKGKMIKPDGVLFDQFKLRHGVWEAKDTQDDIEVEVRRKFEIGYPRDNIIFQSPERAIIWQHGTEVVNDDITKPEYLIEALNVFFQYQPPHYDEWRDAVEEFKQKVPELGAALMELIEKERKGNRTFIKAFEDFANLCQTAINPNISVRAVEEMLIQHLLTERIFSKVFDNPDFVRRNIIAHEIEKVVTALISQHFSKHEFLKKLDRFYGAIETTASTIDDYSEKQSFLNTVYEKFFQGFSVKVADTHGIVYTPQPIVNFMVKSVEEILQKEFGRSLSDQGVHILDPFVGTGNFINRVMREMKRTALPDKYAEELHCNEVMLLPYYIASMNIEHAYYELTGEYKPFEGICLVDTFEPAKKQSDLFIAKENTERVSRQWETPIFVVIGNPPYNVGQVNENDNNKNRRYPEVEKRVRDTYAKDSRATNKNALSDVYVKAIRWASDRIGDEGIVAFVSNNSFFNEIAFDGMRKHLAENFDEIYVVDLGGNVRKNPKLSGTTHNVFGIQVGVSINIFVKKTKSQKQGKVFYARLDEFWKKEQKYEYLNANDSRGKIKWGKIKPDAKYNWLTEGLHDEFETFLPMGSKDKKGMLESEQIFSTFSNGVKTNRDQWAYNFSRDVLIKNMTKTVDVYNDHVARLADVRMKDNIDEKILIDEEKISWSRDLKLDVKRGRKTKFSESKLRHSLYRPFCQKFLFFDKIFNEEVYQFPNIFPTQKTECENKVICVAAIEVSKDFHCIISTIIPDIHLTGDTQCFPFYTYDEDGRNRKENITDWGLAQFRERYRDNDISKRDIFHYVYGLLHHPAYRKKYAANLRRDLPRIPFAPDFWAFAEAGEKLAELHVNYEEADEYPLKVVENPDKPLNWRVEKMKLSKDKTQIIYNDFLTLSGIPPEAFEYRLGNRSALDWIIDQYRVKTDKRSGIVNDPNREEDPQYIVRLIGKVMTVSLETMKIVKKLPQLNE